VILGIRPQDFEDAHTADGLPMIDVQAVVVEDLGSATHVLFAIDAPPVEIDAVQAATDEPDRPTLIATDRRVLFTAELPEGTSVKTGERIRLGLNPARLHFFDPETSETLRPVAASRA
jgi:multiple sugar transport system ATP-binding protein